MSKSPLPFVPPSVPQSPLRVAPGGRFFETADGKPFLFIGPNDAISWPGLAGLYRRRDPAAAEAYVAGLAESGVNVLRLMLEYAHRDGWYFEKPFGTFNPVLVRLWDDLFLLCARHGIRILLTPWDTFWMARRWHRHPYNAANGGPAAAPSDFFTQEKVWEATERRFQFVVERWGGDGTLAAWDLFNEIHPHWGGTAIQQSEVIARLSASVRDMEQKCWGFTRPQTVSVFGPNPSADYEDLILRHPALDFATTHIYQGAIDHPHNTITPALTMAQWVRHAAERIAPGRPFLDTEHGPIHLFNDRKQMLEEAFDDEYERRLMWAHLASGGAGSGMRWPARHPHLLTPGMLRALSGMAQFARLMDWSRFTPVCDALQTTVPDKSLRGKTLLVFGCRDAHQAVLWLLPDTRGKQKAERWDAPLPLELHGLCPGPYRATPWDTERNAALDTQTASTDGQGTLRLLLPPGREIALAITALGKSS